jgi:hypothetical protein
VAEEVIAEPRNQQAAAEDLGGSAEPEIPNKAWNAATKVIKVSTEYEVTTTLNRPNNYSFLFFPRCHLRHLGSFFLLRDE